MSDIILDPFKKGFNKQNVSIQIDLIGIKIDKIANLSSWNIYSLRHMVKHSTFKNEADKAELLNKLHDTFNMLGEINDISDMLNELTSKVSSLEKQTHKGASTNE